MPVAAPLPILAAALLTCAGAACGDVGDGGISGPSLTVPDCGGPGVPRTFEPFAMTLDFASVYEVDDVVTVRLAPRANRIQSVDQLGLVIPDAGAIRASLKADGVARVALATTLDGAPASTTSAALSLTLLGRCKLAAASLGGVGALELTALGHDAGESVRGSFDVDIVDRRTGEVVGPGMHGELDFVIETGSPYTAFSPHDY